MLVLVTCVSLAIGAVPATPSFPANPDTIKTRDQDTLGRPYPNAGRGDTASEEHWRTILRSRPGRVLGKPEKRGELATTVDLLLKERPDFRTPLLRELLIPSTPLPNDEVHAQQVTIDPRALQDTAITTFERMGLIAKRYAVVHPTDNSLKAFQIDLIGTYFWLREVLK